MVSEQKAREVVASVDCRSCGAWAGSGCVDARPSKHLVGEYVMMPRDQVHTSRVRDWEKKRARRGGGL